MSMSEIGAFQGASQLLPGDVSLSRHINNPEPEISSLFPVVSHGGHNAADVIAAVQLKKHVESRFIGEQTLRGSGAARPLCPRVLAADNGEIFPHEADIGKRGVSNEIVPTDINVVVDF